MTEKDKGGNALMKRPVNELVQADFGELAGLGFEDIRPEELQIPFLSLLQDLSDQVKGTTKVEGAAIGMFFNTVSEELFDTNDEDKLLFVPALRDHCYMEWIPRKKGGGLVGRIELDDPIVAVAKDESEDFGKYKTPAGNDLVETYYVYGVLIANGEPQPICIAFTSSKIGVWKKYFTRMSYVLVQSPDGGKQKPPMCAHRIILGSKDDKNKKTGDEFKNITLVPEQGTIKDSLVTDIDDEILQSAVGLLKMIQSGDAKADFDSQRTADKEASDDDSDPEGVFDDDVM